MVGKELAHNALPRYDHNHYELRRRFLQFLIRTIGLTLLAKVDSIQGQENIPRTGPAIVMINHIALIDPIVLLPFASRRITPMAKIEVYNYPLVGILPRIYGVIPVRREEFDRQAIRQALDVLEAGEIILVAPEGTRGPELKQGKEGIAYLASRSGAPIVPTAIKGTQGFPALRFTSRWRKPGVEILFGPPFRYKQVHNNARQDTLRQMTDEAMFVLASILPPGQRGFYSDLDKATQDTIEFVQAHGS